jgi:peroxiredoxin Q/BCP
MICSGCTTQACDLRDNIEALNQVQAVVIGVSRDPVADLAKFRKDHRLNFYLASDADGLVTEAYGVWKLRKMMGREFMGIERSTFIIKDGVIKKVWRGVKAAEHLDWVKRSLEELKMSAL